MNFKLTKSSLNFKVYTSLTIPSSGTENDIVIISTTPMENWILSSDTPVGEPRNRGDVWIQYSVSGNVFDIMNQHDFMLAITKVYQYVGRTWMSVNARRYVGGVWDVVSSAFSATISITYPANSTCTVTNPSGQIVANDTNATSSPQTFTAIVGATGTYTVTATATDGSGDSASQTVEITTEGQSVSVELSYIIILYDKGVVSSLAGGFAGTGGYADYGRGNYNVSGAALSIDVESGYGTSWAVISAKNAIDVTDFNTLRFNLTILDTLHDCDLAVGLTKQSLDSDFAVSANPNSTGVIAVDVSGTSGLLYPTIYGSASYAKGWQTRGSIKAEVDRIELE